MHKLLGYKIDLFEDYSISDDLSKLVLASGGCSHPTCQVTCVDCFSGCYQGPDPGPDPETN